MHIKSKWFFYLIIPFILGLTSCEEKKETIKIGVILPLTGSNANYGKYIQNGLNLALKDINSDDSLKQFELIFEDDRAEATAGINAINKLISSGDVKVIFGPWASSSALAVAPIAEKKKIILMAEAISPQLKKSGDYIFRIQPDAKSYIDKLVSYISSQRPAIKKVAILYINNDFGVDQSAYIKTSLESIGKEVVFEQAFAPKASDFRTSISAIKATSPDAVFCPAYAELSNILIQMNELGLKVQVFGSVPTENPSIVKAASGAANGVIYPSQFDPSSTIPRFKKFTQNYKEAYGEYPEGFASLAFDGLHILCKAIKSSKNNDVEGIKADLYSTRNYQGVNGLITFDKDGDVTMPIVIKQVVDDSFNVIWK
jgi:branched-chain amino acid transport system substrate-binding protein